MPDVERVCKVCRKIFYARKYRVLAGRALFCSNACRAQNEHSKPFKSNGYAMRYMPEHPNANLHGHVYEHVLVAARALGRGLKRGEEVHHLNGQRDDNRNTNLLICTKSYHQRLHGKDKPKGSHCPQSKLTEEQVQVIRGMSGTHTEVGKIYGVSYRTISLIRSRVTWKHV